MFGFGPALHIKRTLKIARKSNIARSFEIE
jgi:hypothetical protein